MVGYGSAYAQEAGDIAVGAGIVFTPGWVEDPTEVSNNGGFGAKIQYNVTTPIRVEGTFTFFPNSDALGMWDLNINAHYLIPVKKKFNVYPVAGFGLMKYKSEGAYVFLDNAVIY